MSLTRKQQAFVNEYLIDFNATQAAIRAGYSARTAYSIGHENLSKPEIDEEIQRRVDERTMSANEALILLAEQAKGAHGKYITANGVNMKQLVEDGMGHLVKGVKHAAHGTNIEFVDQQAALFKVLQVHGLLKDQVEVTGKDGEPLQVEVQSAIEKVYGDGEKAEEDDDGG